MSVIEDTENNEPEDKSTQCDEWCGHPSDSDECWCKPTPQK